MHNSLLNSNTQQVLQVKHIAEYPIPGSDEEKAYIMSEDYLAWRKAYPVGALLARKIKRSSEVPFMDDLHKMHVEERAHIAVPLDYLGTVPDNEIRWKV